MATEKTRKRGKLKQCAVALLCGFLFVPFTIGATQHNLGTFGGTKSISGRITTADANGYDIGIYPYQHVYSFRAAASGTMRISSFSTSNPKGNGSVSITAYATHTTEWYNPGSGTMPVTKGEEYAVRVYSYQALSQTFSFTLYVPGSSGGGGSGGGGGGGIVKITFAANGGQIDYGSSSVLLLSGDYFGYDVPSCHRKGYAFAGWYTKKSGGKKIDSSSKVPSSATVYYAHWKANKYKIAFNKNGGKGSMKTLSATYGKKVTLRANAFKKSGYKFKGWAKKKNGTVAYKNKAKVKNLTATNGKTVTLYAVWKKAK